MSMHRRALLTLGLGSLLPPVAQALDRPAELQSVWPKAQLIGSGRMRFLGLSIYDAHLWAPAPLSAADWSERPLAIELVYTRSLQGAQIAERSLDEMRRQLNIGSADAERWLATMKATFPDVRDGDRLTGIYRLGDSARFYWNGGLRRTWSDAALAKHFFGIWLSPQTSEPSLREALFGGRI